MSQPPGSSEKLPPPSGEAAAWMVEYGPALRRYFRKKVGAAEAEDLVQDVFLALQQRDLGAVEHLDRYIFGVASKVLARRWRSRSVRTVEPEGLDPLALLVEELSPERALVAKETLQRLVGALGDLPPRAAQAFILHRFEEMSYGEIAAHMGIGVRTVESHIERTLSRLLAILGPR